MASVKWIPDGLDSLLEHDDWRFRNHWEPIGLELMDAVEHYFRDQNPDKLPHFLPGRPVELDNEETDRRMVLITVRSKEFRVLFRYDHAQHIFEITELLHPKAQ